jgi:hypothetical protein
MHRLALTVSALCLLTSAASANDPKVERMLQKLDPDARFEQVCDLEAMKYISKDKTYKPERTVVSALSQPKIAGATMTGTGGAFLSKKLWYQFSFTCKTSPDHMAVLAFSYKIGEAIPQEEWEKHGLW